MKKHMGILKRHMSMRLLLPAAGILAMWGVSAALHVVLLKRLEACTVMVLVGAAYAGLLVGVLVWKRRVLSRDVGNVVKRPFLAAFIVLAAVSGYLLPWVVYMSRQRD
jgi:hypothetical protein